MKRIYCCLWLLLIPLMQYAQADPKAEKVTLSGYIKDASSGEELIYANVYVGESGIGATSNLYGFYSITLPRGTYELSFSYIGYETVIETIDLQNNQTLNVELSEEGTLLEEIVVKSKKEDEAIHDIRMSRQELDIEQLKKMPALLGEPDVIKMVQTMPGVTIAGEGTSAFFVRGGSADQNLIQIDEAPVYDASHLFGLFSVFNADIIKNAELYKGGIPAQFGGRLSSLLDVRTRDGNNKQFVGSGGIGLLASRLTLEGPIVKDKASFIVAGRRSYVDLFMGLSEDTEDTRVSFHDLNAKLNWRADNKNRFFLSAYSGRDNWVFDDNFGFNWGNTTATFRWNHLFNDRLFSNLTLVYSDFDYSLEDKDDVEGFTWTANQKEMTLKEDFHFFISPKITLNFGYHGTYRRFMPGLIEPASESSLFERTDLPRNFALEHAVYLGADQVINDRLSLQYGLRFSVFQNIGKSTVYTYEDFDDNTNINIVDSTSYGHFENIKTFHALEPRFSARYLIDQSSSVKLSYNRMMQYIHLVSNSTVPIPFNTWTPSGPYVEPQMSDQVAIGYFKNLKDNSYELSAELFYKQSKDVTDFADNASIFFNEHLVKEFRQGEQESYGLEFYAQKKKGRLQGFLSYTLSKAEMTVPGVNNDQAFPANHDRRHALNIVANYALNDYWNIGAAFTYTSGRPITLPTGRYEFDGYQANLYSERNGYKLPDFHRLDLSATYEFKKNEGRRFKQSIVFGVYNAYNNQNPFTIYTRTKQDDDGNIIGDGTEKEARLVYLFGALPYFTWNFKF